MITSPVGQRFPGQQYSPQGYPQGFPGQYGQRSPIQGLQSPQQYLPQGLKQSPVQGIKSSPLSNIRQFGNQQPIPAGILPAPHQSVIQQVERIEQPLQVVDLYQVEEPWRQRVYQLEREIAALRGQPQEKTVFVDDGKAADIEKELSQAFAQIQQLINTIKILQEENLNFQKHNDEKRRRIEQLEAELRAKEQEIADAQQIIDELNAQLDELSGEQEEKNSYLIKEVNVWKQKFIDLNKEFHQVQETLMLAQAELDNLKHAGVTVTKVSETTKKSTTR